MQNDPIFRQQAGSFDTVGMVTVKNGLNKQHPPTLAIFWQIHTAPCQNEQKK
jgi:hypothetical protein